MQNELEIWAEGGHGGPPTPPNTWRRGPHDLLRGLIADRRDPLGPDVPRDHLSDLCRKLCLQSKEDDLIRWAWPSPGQGAVGEE